MFYTQPNIHYHKLCLKNLIIMERMVKISKYTKYSSIAVQLKVLCNHYLAGCGGILTTACEEGLLPDFYR